MILMIWFDLYLFITLDSNIFMLRIVPFLLLVFVVLISLLLCLLTHTVQAPCNDTQIIMEY